MLTNRRPVQLLLRLAMTGFAALVAVAAFAPAALAYPAPDGPDMQGGAPSVPAAVDTGSSIWTFVLVASVTAVVAILATLVVLRASGRIVRSAPRAATLASS